MPAQHVDDSSDGEPDGTWGTQCHYTDAPFQRSARQDISGCRARETVNPIVPPERWGPPVEHMTIVPGFPGAAPVLFLTQPRSNDHYEQALRSLRSCP